MKSRCQNPSFPKFADYGARGITICAEWQNFEAFQEWALANGYDPTLTLDRIDVNGNYEPSNCRWTTPYIQTRNKRSNVQLTAFGETKIISDWLLDPRCALTTFSAVRRRLARGFSPEDALSRPPTNRNNQKKPVTP